MGLDDVGWHATSLYARKSLLDPTRSWDFDQPKILWLHDAAES